jgi:hypothetical protein
VAAFQRSQALQLAAECRRVERARGDGRTITGELLAGFFGVELGRGRFFTEMARGDKGSQGHAVAISGPRNDADRRRFGLLVSGLGAILAVARRVAIALRRVRVLIVLPFDRF